MNWKNPFRKGPKALDGSAGETGASDPSPLGDAIIANEAVKKKQMLLLGAGESVIRLMPPLMVSREMVDEAMAIFDRVLTHVEAEL